MHVPFLVAASLSALSIFCTYTLLPRTGAEAPRPTSGPAGPGGKRPSAFDFKTYAEYFRTAGRCASLYLQFFLFSFAFSLFTSGFALFAERRFLYERLAVDRPRGRLLCSGSRACSGSCGKAG